MVPTPTAVAVPVVVPVVEASPPMQDKLIDQLVQKKTLNTFTPVATEEATPAPSVPALKQLLLKVCKSCAPILTKGLPLHPLCQSTTSCCSEVDKVFTPVPTEGGYLCQPLRSCSQSMLEVVICKQQDQFSVIESVTANRPYVLCDNSFLSTDILAMQNCFCC